jgi:hypothetical protein
MGPKVFKSGLYSGSYVVALGIKMPSAVIAALRIAVTTGPTLHEGSVEI